MLCWMSGKTIKENIRKKIVVTPIVEKIMDIRFRGFGHVERDLLILW